jgi:hypothetical protein
MPATRRTSWRGKRGRNARTIQTIVGVAALLAILVYLNYRTLSPCEILREAVRQREGLAAVLPDGVVDLGISAQIGAMSPARCIVVMLYNLNTPIHDPKR